VGVGAAAGAAGAGGDCSRNNLTGGTTCRPAKFAGNNGGATHRGISKDAINVVAYQVKQNEQVQAILNTTGTASDADRQAVLPAFEKWFNDNYETYGRRVKLIWFKGSSAANDPAGQQADAVRAADELDAFAVVTNNAGQSFYDELHRKGIPAFTWQQYANEVFEERAPHLFGILPDRDIVLGHLGEYICRRVAGRNAVHAGDPLFRANKRKIGILYQAETDNGPFLEKLLAGCGVKVDKMLSYPADISQAVAIATNAVAQMREAGISTVTCICDPIAPIYLTQQATNQGWLPEWLHNGYAVTDAPQAGRLYDQSQWGRSFGVSAIGYPRPLAGENGYKICRAGGGPEEACVRSSVNYYSSLAYAFNAIESAGPDLNDRSFAQAIYNFPAVGGTSPTELRASFGRNGPGPYTLIDDVMEIWWSPERPGPDGKPGTPFYVGNGRRYSLTQWPQTDAVPFRDDGSPQPPRDPDQ
jgi:hypothetical protein